MSSVAVVNCIANPGGSVVYPSVGAMEGKNADTPRKYWALTLVFVKKRARKKSVRGEKRSIRNIRRVCFVANSCGRSSACQLYVFVRNAPFWCFPSKSAWEQPSADLTDNVSVHSFFLHIKESPTIWSRRGHQPRPPMFSSMPRS